MFAFTIKSKISKKLFRLFLLVGVTVLCVSSLIFSCVVIKSPKKEILCEMGEYRTNLTEKNSVADFASQFDKTPKELVFEKEITIPQEFNETFEEYNELQKTQGLDLTSYRGKGCILSVYELSDYLIEYKKAYMTILVYKDTVIGGHISTFVDNADMLTFFGE